MSTITESQSPIPAFPKQGFPAMQACEVADVITTVVSPIFFLIAAGLTIYYTIRPMPPMIPIGPTFAVPLPLVICSSTGVICVLIFTIQIVCYKQLRLSFESSIGQVFNCFSPLQRVARLGLHPGGRGFKKQTIRDFAAEYDFMIRRLQETWEFKKVSFETRDGVDLVGYWHKKADPNAPTVLYFHGNNMNAEDMSTEWFLHYQTLGFNILIVEYRGYGLSGGKEAEFNQEMEAYLDAEAAYKFALSQGIDPDLVTAHGYSLGGAYAAALGYFFGVKKVVLERSFTKFADVFCHLTPFSLDFSEKAVSASYKQAHVKPDPQIPHSRALRTDGFDSLAKIREMPGRVFVIQGKDDEIMDVNFGYTLVQTKYPSDEEQQKQHLAVIGGSHGDAASFFEHEVCVEQFNAFIKSAA